MLSYWIRFKDWLQKNAPHLILAINEGATQKDIETLETVVGKKLPDEFVDFYKIHNGQNEQQFREGLINSEELLSINEIIGQWECWKELLDNGDLEYEGLIPTSEPEKGIKNDWWNPLWIPFTHDGSGNHICIDLDPASGGTFGQVIRMWHDSGYRKLYASSFTEYISNYISGLETGQFVYVQKFGLVHKDSSFNQP
jgi:cell wall assembly regulator SMI1